MDVPVVGGPGGGCFACSPLVSPARARASALSAFFLIDCGWRPSARLPRAMLFGPGRTRKSVRPLPGSKLARAVSLQRARRRRHSFTSTNSFVGISDANGRRYDELFNDTGPSSPRQFCPDCIITTRGSDFWERQGYVSRTCRLVRRLTVEDFEDEKGFYIDDVVVMLDSKCSFKNVDDP